MKNQLIIVYLTEEEQKAWRVCRHKERAEEGQTHYEASGTKNEDYGAGAQGETGTKINKVIKSECAGKTGKLDKQW